MTKLIKDFRRKLANKSVLALQKVHCISTNSDNRMCATNGAGTAYISIAHEFTPVFSGVRVTQSLVLCVCILDRCLSFSTFSFGHCVVCPSFDLRILIAPLVSSSSFGNLHYRIDILMLE